MKRLIGLIIIAILFSYSGLYAQSTDEFLNTLNGKINEYYLSRPHDNVYVHTDRSVYFSGEEIMLRIVVADAANLMPSGRSDVCNIVLVSEDGEPVNSVIFNVQNGDAHGSFRVPDGLTQGVYALVAYVMKDNMVTTNKVFNKALVIVDPSELLMLDFELDKEEYAPGDEVTLTLNAYGRKSRSLSGVNVEAVLKQGVETIETLKGKTSRDGHVLLKFSIPEEIEGNYCLEVSAEKRKAARELRICLPMDAELLARHSPENNKNGIRLSGEIEHGNRLKIFSETSASGPDDDTKIILSLFRKGLIYWSAPGELHQISDISIPLNRVPSGILDVVLFSMEGEVLAEEFIYYQREDGPEIEVVFDRDKYGKRQLVKTNLGIQGNVNVKEDQMRVSVSVAPVEFLPPDEMLLDEQMLIDADLEQDTRKWLNGVEENERTKVINRMVNVFDRNGYSWDLVTGKSEMEDSADQQDFFEEEIVMDLHFPSWFEAGRMYDFKEGIKDTRHPDADELFYVKQLENGTPVLDVIKSIKPYTMMGNRIIFPGTNNSINNQQGALIVIDNIQAGEDASVLNTISPNQIESINISTSISDIQKYTGLNVVGVIEITMKGYEPGSRLEDKKPRDEIVRTAYGHYLEGYPDYSVESDEQEVIMDHRRLLYWNPEITFDQSAETSFEFYTSDMPGDYVMTIQGMLGTVPVAVRKVFTVE